MAIVKLQDITEVIEGIITRIRKLEIRGNGSVIKTGEAADRPVAPNVGTNTTTIYYAYDTKVLSVWNNDDAAWDETTLT